MSKYNAHAFAKHVSHLAAAFDAGYEAAMESNASMHTMSEDEKSKVVAFDRGEPQTQQHSMTIDGHTYHIGDQVESSRRKWRRRGPVSCTIVKFRPHATKSMMLQPDDGRNPFWAINSNVA